MKAARPEEIEGVSQRSSRRVASKATAIFCKVLTLFQPSFLRNDPSRQIFLRKISSGRAALKCPIFCLITTLLLPTTIFPNLSISLELSDIHYLKNRSGQIRPTIFVGDSFELKAIVAGATQAPDNLQIPGLEHFVVRGQSSSSNISIHNSSLLAEKTTVYSMLANRTGTFTLGPATIKHKGKSYQSKAITVHVARKSSLQSQPVESPNTSVRELFCKLTADKQTVVTEEPVVVTLSACRTNNAQLRGFLPPKFPNCTVKEIKHAKESRQKDRDKTLIVTQKQYLVFPKKPGKLTIPPVQAVYTVQEQRKHKNPGFRFFNEDFFSDFFSSQVKQKVAASNPLVLTVNALPEVQERVDAVGNFSSFVAKIDKTKVVANEPMKFTLELTGHTNFDLVLPPALSLPEKFKTYDSKVELAQDLTHRHMPGKKSFEFIFQVPEQGEWTIPAQTFYYFDTGAKTYKTMRTDPIPITVSMPQGARSAPKLSSEQEAQTPTVADIHFIEEQAQPTEQPSQSLPLWSLLLLMLLIPLLFYIKNIWLVIAPVFSRRKNIFLSYQKKLIDLIEYNEFEKLYSLFIGFFATASGMSISSINEERVAQVLEKKGLEKEKIDSFLSFLHACAQYSFASKEMTTQDLQDLQKRANYWLLVLSKVLKNKRFLP